MVFPRLRTKYQYFIYEDCEPGMVTRAFFSTNRNAISHLMFEELEKCQW